MTLNICDLRSVKGSEWKKSISGREGGLVCGGMERGPTRGGNEELVVSGDSADSCLLSGSGDATCSTVTRVKTSLMFTLHVIRMSSIYMSTQNIQTNVFVFESQFEGVVMKTAAHKSRLCLV